MAKKFIMEEDILLCDKKVFGDNEEHSFNCKCYDGYAECTATDSEEKIQKVTMTYPLRKDVLKSEGMSNAVLEYRGLYDCTKKDIHYGDIMMKYGKITKTGK
jgi:hypothetical protein